MNKIRLGIMNEELRKDAAGYIARCNSEYMSKLRIAASQIIAEADEKPLILLSGPSGSGKTTTALLLERMLDRSGLETHLLSMDNYYYRTPDMQIPKDEHGETDYESPLLLDIHLLQEQFRMIEEGQPVELPTYDFVRQCRAEETIPLQRKRGEIILMEGIHALNPEVIGSAFLKAQTIYISPRTRIAWSGGLLHPERIRLMRRMLRDSRTRGQSMEETVSRLWSVSRGERLYIFPNKSYAAISIDTLVPYEISLYRDELLAKLKKEAINDTDDLIGILTETEPISEDLIGPDALVREFIGGWKG